MARKKKIRSATKQYAIVGDGFTEKIYFEQLKESESIKDFTIKPQLPNKKGKGGGHVRVLQKVKELLHEGYDHVYCLIDFDKVVQENNTDNFRKDCLLLDQEKVTILINNPCFEVWFVLHFEKTGKLFSSGDEVEKKLCQHIKDYSKNQQYLQKKNIYSYLKPMLFSKAIPNAEFLERNREEQCELYPRAEVYKLMKDLVRN